MCQIIINISNYIQISIPNFHKNILILGYSKLRPLIGGCVALCSNVILPLCDADIRQGIEMLHVN